MNYYGLTNPQESIWSMEEFYNGTNINNICGTLTIKQKINLDKLNEAVNIFVQNNKSFGLHFTKQNGKIVQYFKEEAHQNFEIVKLKDTNELKKFAEETTEYIFNVYDNSLYKFILFELENGYGGFVILTHHLISDAATFGMIGTEIVENYTCLISGKEISKKDFSYEDYIKDEKEYMESSKFKKAEEYWNNLYNTIPEVASIPSLKSKSSLDGAAKREDFLVGKKLFKQIAEFCKERKISNFNFFMAIYAIYLSKISNLDDFAIGTPILNRSTFKEKHTTGMFINTAALRITVDSGISFLDFVHQIAESSLSMLRYQKYPYEMLLENLRKKDSSIPNLFDVMLSYQITKANDKQIETPYEVEWLPTSTISNGLSIHLHDNNDSENLHISYDYQVKKYDVKYIKDMHNRILHIIDQVLENENILENDIEIVTEKEKEKILDEFNNTYLEYDSSKTLIEYFEEQVKKAPNSEAIVFHGKSLTYAELNGYSNSLARFLRNKGIANNSIVGVMLNRSFEMIVSILAVLKAGGAYIPVDPEYPEDRVTFMLSQSESTILLTQKHLKDKIQKMNFKGEIVYADFAESKSYSLDNSNLNRISKMQDLSYIIYTSGSTGTPKGVMLTQKTFSNFIASMFDKIDYLKDDIPHSIVSITTVSFDIFAFETLVSLCGGLKLYLTDEQEQKNTEILEKLLLENNIEIIQTTPSVMNFHLENSCKKGFANLKYVMLAGEQLPINLVNKLKAESPKVTVYNGYGPSETTIFSATENVTNLDNITIGKPIANTQIYILNKDLCMLPPNTMRRNLYIR